MKANHNETQTQRRILIYNVFRQIEANNDHNIEKKRNKMQKTLKKHSKTSPLKNLSFGLYILKHLVSRPSRSQRSTKKATKWQQTNKKNTKIQRQMLIYNVFRQIESNNDHNIEKKRNKMQKL